MQCNMSDSGPRISKPILSLRDLRQKTHRLSLIQAARALDIAPSALEKIEAAESTTLNSAEVNQRYEAYKEKVIHTQFSGENVLFGSLSFGAGRAVLGMSVKELADHFGYKESTWKKIEANARFLSRSDLDAFEQMVADHMATLLTCAQNTSDFGQDLSP